MISLQFLPTRNAVGLALAALTFVGSRAPHTPPRDAAAVSARLSEWKVELSRRTVAAGAVTFTVTNAGSVPHAFEVEGQGIERGPTSSSRARARR